MPVGPLCEALDGHSAVEGFVITPASAEDQPAVVRRAARHAGTALARSAPEPVIINNSFVNHNDHRVTGLATVDAVYPTARDRLNFPEHLAAGLATHKVRELYLWGANQPTFTVDITPVLDAKIEALLLHRSQFTDEIVPYIRERWVDAQGHAIEQFRRVVLFR